MERDRAEGCSSPDPGLDLRTPEACARFALDRLAKRLDVYDIGSNVVDVYVGYLRKKLGGASIATVRGMGYRLET